MNLNYRHLYCFWTAARSGGIGRAAEELGLSQPTLSSQISSLERSCGHRLLARGPRGARLTPEGETVMVHCHRIFEAGLQLEADIEAGLDAAPRTLRVGAHGAVPRSALLQILDAVRRSDPDIRLGVTTSVPTGLTARLEAHLLDLVVTTLDLSLRLGRGFRARPVGSIPLVFVAAPSLAARIGRFPGGLSGVPLLLRGEDNPVSTGVIESLQRRGVAPRVEMQADDAELLKALALGGRGVAALALPTAREDIRSGRLVRLHKGPSGLREAIWLVSPKSERARPGLEKALAVVMGRFTLGRNLTTDPV